MKPTRALVEKKVGSRRFSSQGHPFPNSWASHCRVPSRFEGQVLHARVRGSIDGIIRFC